MTRQEFVAACMARMETLYQEDNAAYHEGGPHREPLLAFRQAPRQLEREADLAMRKFGGTWDSEWK